MTTSFLGNGDGRNFDLKQKILGFCINDDFSIAELSKELITSIPTITKLVGELIDDGFLTDMGKQGTSGGRRPSIFGLNPSVGYIVGVEAGKDALSVLITNFKGQQVDYVENIAFSLEDNQDSFKRLTEVIIDQCRKSGIAMSDVLTCGLTLSGRVNSATGYSFTYYISEDKPLTELLSDHLGVPVAIENDSRAMAYGEYLRGATTNEKNVVLFNVGWGLGSGMILDGKLYYGKSGFSGEIGHFPMLDNDVICQCGKVGCLETGASGSAVHRLVLEKLKDGRSSCLSAEYSKKERITLDDIIKAVEEEDVLTIEVVEEIGANLGRGIAGVINFINPELVIIGGKLSKAKDYLMLPVKSAIKKYSLNMVSKDTSIKFSKLGSKSGPLGACLLARNKLLGIEA